MRNRIASTLRRWAYRIEGHRPARRAHEALATEVFASMYEDVTFAGARWLDESR